MNTTFGVGNVLSTGFRIWIKNFIPFMLITALIYSPVLIWGISGVQGEMTQDKFLSAARVLQYVGGLTMLLNILVSSALTYGVVMELQGQRASIGACITTGLVRFFPTLAVALLSILCIAGGVILLFVGSIVFACMLYVATPAAVLERPGVLGALKRSRELTKGHKLEIFGLMFLLGLLGFGVTKVCQAMALPHLGQPGSLDETMRNLPKYMYMNLGQQMVLGSLGAVMSSVAYYFLRAEKEGTSADELAAVFG
jgi:hypothetical protein